MSQAMKAVFGTPELLEDILKTALLQGMTHSELLRAQKVCRDWKVTIDGSPLLQKALYLRPVTTKADFEFFRQWTRNDKNGWSSYTTRDCHSVGQGDESFQVAVFTNPSTNTTLDKDLPDIPGADACGIRHGAEICSDEAFRHYQDYNRTYLESADPWIHRTAKNYELLATGAKRAVFEAWNQPNASWNHMLLSQPPPIAVTIRYSDNLQKEQNKVVRNNTGLTFGDVFSAAMAVHEPNDAKSALDFAGHWGFGRQMAVDLRDFWKASGDHVNDDGWRNSDNDDNDTDDLTHESEDYEDWEDYAEHDGYGSLDEYDSDNNDEDDNGEANEDLF